MLLLIQMQKYLPLQGTQFAIMTFLEFFTFWISSHSLWVIGLIEWTKKSKDGCIKLWDGVSHRCYSTLERAHDGYEVCSVQFTKNGKFLLTSGKDSICRLWEISTSRVIHQFTGAELSGRQMHRSNACFNHTEEHVMFPCKFPSSIRPDGHVPVRTQWHAYSEFRREKCFIMFMEFSNSGTWQTVGTWP